MRTLLLASCLVVGLPLQAEAYCNCMKTFKGTGCQWGPTHGPANTGKCWDGLFECTCENCPSQAKNGECTTPTPTPTPPTPTPPTPTPPTPTPPTPTPPAPTPGPPAPTPPAPTPPSPAPGPAPAPAPAPAANAPKISPRTLRIIEIAAPACIVIALFLIAVAIGVTCIVRKRNRANARTAALSKRNSLSAQGEPADYHESLLREPVVSDGAMYSAFDD